MTYRESQIRYMIGLLRWWMIIILLCQYVAKIIFHTHFKCRKLNSCHLLEAHILLNSFVTVFKLKTTKLLKSDVVASVWVMGIDGLSWFLNHLQITAGFCFAHASKQSLLYVVCHCLISVISKEIICFEKPTLGGHLRLISRNVYWNDKYCIVLK